MKRPSIILSLLTLTLALATLPAFGQSPIVYESDITKYKFMDKVPLTTSNQKAGEALLEVTYDDGSVKNLVSVDGSTWTSSSLTSSNVNNLEHYDQAPDNYTFTTGATGTWEATTVSNSILSAKGNPLGWRQFQVMSLPIKAGNDYVFTAKVRGTVKANTGVTVYIGSANFDNTQAKEGGGYEDYLPMPITTEWQEVTLTFENAGTTNNSAQCMIQPRNYNGVLEIKDIKITTTNNTVLHTADYSAGDAYTGQPYAGTARIREKDGNRTLLGTRKIGSFKIYRNANLSQGTFYKARIQISGSEAGNVTLKLGSSEKTVALPVSTDGTFGEVEVTFAGQSADVTGADLIIDPGNYNGTIRVKSTSLYALNVPTDTPTGNSTTKYFNNEADFPTETNPEGIVFTPTTNEHGTYLHVPSLNQFWILDGLDLKKDMIYTLTIGALADRELKDIKVQLGDYGNELNGTITIPQTPNYNNNITCTFDGTFAEDISNGYCQIQFWGKSYSYIEIGEARLSWKPITGETLIGTDSYGSWDLVEGESYLPVLKDNMLVAEPEGGAVGKFIIYNNVDLTSGSVYRAKIELCGSNGGTATLSLGSSSQTITLPPGDTPQSVTVDFDAQSVDLNGANLILDPGSNYNGTIKVKSTSIYSIIPANTKSTIGELKFNQDTPDPIPTTVVPDGTNIYIDTSSGYGKFLHLPSALRQVWIFDNFELSPNKTYKFIMGATADNAVSDCRIALGQMGGSEITGSVKIPSRNDEKPYDDNITCDFQNQYFSSDDLEGKNGSTYCAIQLYYAGNFGSIDIGEAILESYTISETETLIGSASYSFNNWSAPYGLDFCPQFNNGILEAKPADELHFQISSKNVEGNNLSYGNGKKYKITLTVKGSKEGSVYGTVGDFNTERPEISFPITTKWETITVPEDGAYNFTKDVASGFYTIWSGSQYDGDIEIKSITLWEDNGGVTEEVGTPYTEIVEENRGYETINNGTYKSSKNKLDRYFHAIDLRNSGRNFENGKTLYITAKIRGSRDGVKLKDGSKEGVNVIVQNSGNSTPGWGWSEKFDITSNWQVVTAKITPTGITSTEDANPGYISFHIGDYDGDFDVDWIYISEKENDAPSVTTLPVSSSDGSSNYFDITLPYNDEDETYFFMIGRPANNDYAPLNFEVINAKTNESYGNYAVGGNYDRSNINVRWEQFMTTTEIIYVKDETGKYVTDKDGNYVELERKQVGVTVPGGEVTKLRFVCTENVGDKFVLMESNGKVYDVPVMTMNRVGVYKQRTFKLTDKDGNPTWAYPLISRFQIEANGIPGNYPGNFTKSYYQQSNPVKDNSAYANKGETMMDAVDNLKGEWGKYQSPGQMLFDAGNIRHGQWNSSTWMTSDNQINANKPYSIDILLPDFNDTKDGKKESLYTTLENAGLIEDGKIKIMLQIERPEDYIGTDYSGNPVDANAYFPTEIRYAGTSETGLDGNGKSKGYVSFPENTQWETINLAIPPKEETSDMAFAINVDPTWRRIRILCAENKSASTLVNAVANAGKDMALSEIRAFIALPRLDLDKFNYDVLYNERLDDVDKEDLCEEANQSKLVKFSNYEWTGTEGINSNINNPTLSGGSKWLRDGTDGAIAAINNIEFSDAAIDLANFNRIRINDYDASDGITPSMKIANHWSDTRQRTYSLTHEILALPGERVDLYPYSDIHESLYYMDHIVRWYDYMTNTTPDYLYFFTDPKAVIKTKAGFIGGKILMDGPYHGPGAIGSVYFSPTNYNENKDDHWIAADFSISVADNFKNRFVNHGTDGAKQFLEPIISFRHIFHIKNGQTFADEFSGDYQKNIEYVKNNRRYISARAGHDFTIRLEHPMPVAKDTHSDLYYKTEDDGYTRVCSYDIRAYKASTFMANQGSITSSNVEPGSVGAMKDGGNMFEPYEVSKYTNTEAIMITSIEGTDKWVRNKREYYRAIYCKAENAKVGKYLVRVYGKDKDGKIINVYGNKDKPLVVAEYEVEFLPSTEASFLPEHVIEAQTDVNDKYYTHTEDYLENVIAKDSKIKRKSVTFDKYAKYNLESYGISADNISKIRYKEDKQISVNLMKDGYDYVKGEESASGSTKTESIGSQVGYRMKLPIAWPSSNYSFAYNADGDYNMFRLADHSAATVYNSGASRRFNDYADPETGKVQRGTYDRTFYKTNGEKKGMFYYVNAASDPGDMVELNVATPCAGSTIYVSGWVNEFNDHMPETANVIINYYANIRKKSDAAGVVSRKIQIHGFETGYIPDESAKMEGTDVNTYGLTEEGNQGEWMHFYYSFVPSATRVSGLLSDDEVVDSYSLVLENNAVSSRGADYAIDEIRAFVTPSTLEVEQLDPLCNHTWKKGDNEQQNENSAISVEVRIPYESLLESFTLDENKETDQNQVKSLYFAVLDKTKYEASLADQEKEYKDNKNNVLDWDAWYKNNQTTVLKKAFAASVISYKQMHNDNVEQAWGSVTFNSTYLNNNGFNKANYPIGKAMYHDLTEDENGTEINRYISFIINPPVKNDVLTNANRDFMVVIGKGDSTNGNLTITPDEGEEVNEALAEALNFCDECGRQVEFTLQPPTDILINGVLQGNRDKITCCENQHPVVQVVLNDAQNNKLVNDDNSVVIDWYEGSYNEFAGLEISNTNENSTNGMSLWQVLYNFRADYPLEDNWNQPCRGETYAEAVYDEDGKLVHAAGEVINPDAKSYTPAMRTYLQGLVDEKKLYLNQTSFIFPEVSFKDSDGNPLTDEDGNELRTKDIYVTAIPVDNNGTLKSTGGKVICSDPTEVKITVTKTSPVMKNGFALENMYPTDMVDVPLRAGLRQLDSATADGTVPTKGQAFTLVASETSDKLIIPLRDLQKAETEIVGVSRFKPLASDPYCYLAVTNDPDQKYSAVYKEGSANVPGDATRSDEINSDRVYDSEYSLPLVGEISMDAQIDGTDFNSVKVTFYKDAMKFKEGYYYTLKFPYEEDYSNATMPEYLEEDSKPCHGETYFTIKVVPEYQKWTGDVSLNWNNDENWTRVSGIDVLAGTDGNMTSKPDWQDRFTKDGTNKQAFSYAPLDFTKVIIPAGATYPQLAARAHDRAATTGSLALSNGHGNAVSYVWAASAPNAATSAYGTGDASSYESAAAATERSSNYQPTLYIQYDMAATTYSGDGNVYCRPWYANACEQIHFNSNAEILNQQNLDYQKAWVDMEMKPYRWYTVASPLYGVVAGDMYLPTQLSDQSDSSDKYYEPGRQMTELFTPITYDTEKNDRFAPAVYQRGWDKGTETVYTVHGESTAEKETVALASTWSHVYNDVTEEYAPGMGYSVKTDVTRLPKYADDYSEEDKQNYVKFRFPKADTGFNYFEDGNSDPGEPNIGTIDWTKEGKLFEGTKEVTLKKKNAGKLFLVGNPFMAHLDMTKFLQENTNIESKFWLLTETEQVAATLNENNIESLITNMTERNASNLSQLAPMQGFFVQAKDGNTSTDTNGNTTLSVKFTPDMMAVQAYNDDSGAPILKAPAVRAVDEDIIRVTARDACGACSTTLSASGESAAIIRLSANAEKGYAASEDVEMIDDSNQRGIRRVYTVAGTMASAINQTPDADGVEVGLMAPADSLTVVTFNGLALEDYLLYDTETGEMTQLYDGFELEMTGSVSGRYFLTAGIDTAEIEDNAIRIVPIGHEVVVTAPAVCGELTVRVFDTLGREVANAEGFEEEVRIGLEPGVYVVEAVGADAGRKSAKLQIR